MRIQDEKLDNLEIVQPTARFVRLTGEVEVLEPIAGPSGPEKRKFPAVSEFHRTLASAGAFAVIMLTIVTGLHFMAFGPPEDPVGLGDLAMSMNVRPESDFESEDVPYIVSDAPPDEGSPGEFVDEAAGVRRVAKRTLYRAGATRAGYRRLRPLPAPQHRISEFTPTTMIIYVEKGEIRTRTETQAGGRFKKS